MPRSIYGRVCKGYHFYLSRHSMRGLLEHTLKISWKIISTYYPYNKFWLLFSYYELLAKSILYHKIKSKSNRAEHTAKRHQILGFNIAFFTYPQLLDMVEEIFVYQEYKFISATPFPVIFDCGSNIGISVLYFKKIFPSAHIVAFEPDHETFELLQANIRNNNLSDVTAYNVALTDNSDKVTLFKKADQAGTLTMSLYESGDKTSMKIVTVKRLSDYINEKVSLIKMDVEGSEVGIIDEMIESKKIWSIERMIIEYHPLIAGKSPDDFIKQISSNHFICEITKTKARNNPKSMLVRCERL
jgi:FkbM family methyltransferase